MIFVRKYDSFWEEREDIQWLSKPRHGYLVFLRFAINSIYTYCGTSELCDFIPVQTSFNRELDIGINVITLLGGEKVEMLRYTDTDSLSNILNEVRPPYAK